MAEAQITRCPHCQTTFRIRLEQLTAAKGAVRCGSCLQVFKATNHFVSGEPKAAAPAPVKEDIVFNDSDDEVPEKFNDDPLEDFGILQPDRDSNETFDNSIQLDDESWEDALLDVDGDLIEDIDMSFGKPNMPKEQDDFVPSLKEGPESDQYHLGGHDEFEQETVEIELTIANSVNDLLDEPLNLARKRQKKAPIATPSSFLWFWLSGAIVMLFALVAQVGYFKFDSWSRNPQYRPAYAFTCERISCQLPAIQDVSLMETQHFMVRPHPKVKQALYIDTLLINSADYQQPFPDLNLIFTGLNDQTIASRHFKPREYLAGELAGSNSMPLNVPIHIAIEISNPGAEAVGYRIERVANH
jgi:predicted Zn finger-like uncharacterized protein